MDKEWEEWVAAEQVRVVNVYVKGSVERIIGTGGGVIFKGAGFHSNDYPSKQSSGSRCGRETPCCGRDSFCGSPKCEP